MPKMLYTRKPPTAMAEQVNDNAGVNVAVGLDLATMEPIYQHANKGEWIVVENGQTTVLTDADFSAQFIKA